jgi:hypothetical protein
MIKRYHDGRWDVVIPDEDIHVLWWYNPLTGGWLRYPIMVHSGPMIEVRWDEDPDPLADSPKYALVHCGPAAPYPGRPQ